MYFVIGICGVCETRQAKDQLDIFMVGYGAKRIAFDCYYRQSQPKAIKPHRVTDGVRTNNRMLFFERDNVWNEDLLPTSPFCAVPNY